MNQLTPMQTFEEKVKGKLKETIADMLPDEVLTHLVHKAVEEQFFEVRRNGSVTASWFVQEVAKLAEPVIKERVSAFVNERHDEITKAIDTYISDQNLMMIALAGMQRNFENQSYQLVDRIMSRMRSGY